MKRIDTYQKFLEKLGIPSGNLELAEIIFEYLISNLSDLKVGESNIITGPFHINDFEIKRISLNLELIETNQVSIPTLVSAALRSEIKSEGIHQVFKESDELDMVLNIAVPSLVKLIELESFFISNKSQLLSTLSHELKHGYDHFKLNKKLSIEMGDYQSFSEVRFGISSIDTFLFLVYFSSQVETSVYATEIGSLLRSDGVTSDEFKDYLTKTRLYDLLDGLSNFNYDDLVSNLLTDVDIIRDRLKKEKPTGEELPIGDPELIDYLLNLIVNNITQRRINNIQRLLPKRISNPFLGMLFGIKLELEDGLEDYLTKTTKKITFKNNRDFFDFWEKRFKFVAIKMKKKLAKLYDMCPTKKILLHQKINQKSIVNPILYDKLIDKTNLYPKK